jgi:hypothetical protein
MSDAVIAWLRDELTWGGVFLGVGLAVTTIAGSVLTAGILLIKVPPLYFQEFYARDPWSGRHPLIRVGGKVAKNLLGVLLLVLGVVLSLPGVPGPGVLTMVIGLVLVDVPGKRRVERTIMGRPRVLRVVNRLRKRFGALPLVLGRRRGLARRGEAVVYRE